MKRSKAIKWFLAITPLFLLGGGWLLSEIRWIRINTPDGKFTTASEYLARSRKPARITKVQKEGNTFYIAHSTMDTWMALPSGPATYVFDDRGRLLEWTRDYGDDPNFRKRWPMPHEISSVEELKQIEFQQNKD